MIVFFNYSGHFKDSVIIGNKAHSFGNKVHRHMSSNQTHMNNELFPVAKFTE